MRAKLVNESNNEEKPTWLKIINTAERDGYITQWEGTAEYIVSAAKEIGKQFDAMHPEERKVFRDKLFKNFLHKIHKTPRF